MEVSNTVRNRTIRIFYSIMIFLFAMNCYADTDFHVSLLSEQIKNPSKLGKTKIEGVGDVNLIARKNGSQVVIHAQGPDGKVIGKAETFIGLKETPIFVMTPQGLKKIIIHWSSKEH